jgi:hypothetical protein
MAKIKMTAIVADMRNKLNGSVFSRNRGGAYVRTKVTPVNPQTAAQVQARSLLTSLSQSFRSLSQAQITAWNSATPSWTTTDIFGDSVVPTGLALYVRLNANITNAGGTLITLPPLPVGAAALEEITLASDVSSSTFTISFLPAAVPADHTMYVEATQLLSPGVNNANSKFRFIAAIAAAGVSPANLYSAYTTKFGGLYAGQKAFVRAKFINKITGEMSLALKSQTIVVA